MKAEEERRRQKEADDAFHQEVDQQAVVTQVQRKNWLKQMNPETVASPLSKEEMNFDRPIPLDEKTTGLVSPQGYSRTTLGVRRNSERVGNRANGCR